jgi:hypothetical protein
LLGFYILSDWWFLVGLCKGLCYVFNLLTLFAQTHGDEEMALKSIHTIFPLTREIIKSNGRDCIEFTKIAIVVLNSLPKAKTTSNMNTAIKSLLSLLKI